MALSQTYKDYFQVNLDKENSSMNANITSRKASFLIKKNPKMTLKPIARVNGASRVQLEPIENQLSQKEKLVAMTQNLKELGLTKKLNGYKVKKALVFEKDKENQKKEMPELVNYKERVVVPARNRFSQQMSKDGIKATTLPEIVNHKPMTKGIAKSESNLDNLKEESADEMDVMQDEEDDHWVLVKGVPSADVSNTSKTIHNDSIFTNVEPRDIVSICFKEYVDDIIDSLKEREVKLINY